MEEEFLRQQDILNPDAIIYEKLSGGTGIFNLEEILEKYRKYLEQRSEAGQVDAVVMHPVTIWERYDKKDKKYKHNHIEDGHLTGDTPIARSEEQKNAWENTYWRKKFGYLKDGEVVETEIAY